MLVWQYETSLRAPPIINVKVLLRNILGQLYGTVPLQDEWVLKFFMGPHELVGIHTYEYM